MEDQAESLPNGKNVIIFSDGTGQVGGIYYDEARTNIYKLFRATRVGPDTSIDSQKQVAFYDPGLGTAQPGGGVIQQSYRRVYNLVCQATGLGITQNIIDCYAALIRFWRPGDRIFLFGFSRGAYTVRCLATVLWHCGIPQVDKDGLQLKRDESSSRRIAAEAVKKVYQHVSSPRDKKYLQQRRELGRLFREDYQSYQDDNKFRPNVFPFFIGVFDTVASLWNVGSLVFVSFLYILGHGIVSFLLSKAFAPFEFWYWSNWLFVWVFSLGMAAYVYTHLKFSTRLRRYWFWDVVHLTNFRQRFYDGFLHSDVPYARHAMSIDERRNSFPRVIWGSKTTNYDRDDRAMEMFEQRWFAGNHADIGGGYGEAESRLSDVALKWMIEAAANPALGDKALLIDNRYLDLKGDPLGILHDETRSSIFRWAKKVDRSTYVENRLHESVLARFSAKTVPQYDIMAAYRPEALRHHPEVQHLYTSIPLPRKTCFQSIEDSATKLKSLLGSSLSEVMRKIMPALNRFGRLDSCVSCLGLVGLLGFVAVALWILLFWQILPWLKEASWQSYPLSYFVELSSSWRGLQIIVDWFLYLPATLVFALLGLVVFWICGAIASKLYVLSGDPPELASK